MIAACTTLDEIVKEIRLRFSAGFLTAANSSCPRHHARSSPKAEHDAKRIDQQEGD
jgi:hypothetical protein